MSILSDQTDLLQTGTHGRATPKRLDDKTDEKQVSKDEFVEYFDIVTEPIGDILALTLGVRHRHLTDDWYLRYITVSGKQKTNEKQFPCHSVILSKATLRPGEGRTSMNYSVLYQKSFDNMQTTCMYLFSILEFNREIT